MTSPTALGPHDLGVAMAAYRDALRGHQALLNRMNVYPVPDGDTGTNMALTIDAVVKALEGLDPPAADPPMADVCRAMAHGSLMGARGNSGVILSQLLRGLAQGLGDEKDAGPGALADALVVASELAQKAVVRPVEGTILTVARAAGEGAAAGHGAGETLVGVVERARASAAEALARTPELLEPLRAAGVVDAGGAGYVLLFDALLSALDGRPLPDPAAPGALGMPNALGMPGALGVPGDPGPPAGRAADGDHGARRPAGVHGAGGAPGAHGAEDGGPRGVADLRYEVMYLLEAPDDAIDAFKDVWSGLGDSIVVVGGSGLWNCHIHTDDVGAAIEAALDIGRPRQIRVTDLAEQVQEERWVRDADRVGRPPGGAARGPAPATGVVAVVAGEGVGRIFRSLGVEGLVPGGQSMNPSTAQLLDAAEALASAQVVLLPNNENVEPVARQVDALSTKTVRVVPTGSIVEGFAALLSYDPAAGVEENAEAMTASAARVVSASVTQAVRDAPTPAGAVRAGDWIGLARGDVAVVGDSLAGAALRLLDTLIDESDELVTVIEGEGATPATTRRITEWLHEEHAGVAIEVHHGGQPFYPYLFGIE